MTQNYSFHISVLASVIFLNTCLADEIIPAPSGDPHYTKEGFFDIHVCNWPDRDNLFFMTLFSTYRFKDVNKIEVFTPDHRKLGEIGTAVYRLIKNKDKPEKRVFISQLDIPSSAQDGWYTSIITMKDGKKYEAKDYIIIHSMGIASGMQPAANANLEAVPQKLSWNKIEGAKYYQVFIKDEWEQHTIFTSELLTKPELAVPKGLLKKGGYYSWRIHARDVNENVLLGDFNHGSLNAPIKFDIKE